MDSRKIVETSVPGVAPTSFGEIPSDVCSESPTGASMRDRPTELQDLTDDELAEIRDAFRACDVNRDGIIDSRDLTHAMSLLGLNLSNEQVQDMVAEVGSKDEISFKDFVGFMARKMREIDSEDDMREVFNSFDLDGNGYLGPQQLEKLLAAMGKDSGNAAIQQMLREADADGDGRVSFEDFMQLMNASQIMYGKHATSCNTPGNGPPGPGHGSTCKRTAFERATSDERPSMAKIAASSDARAAGPHSYKASTSGERFRADEPTMTHETYPGKMAMATGMEKVGPLEGSTSGNSRNAYNILLPLQRSGQSPPSDGFGIAEVSEGGGRGPARGGKRPADFQAGEDAREPAPWGEDHSEGQVSLERMPAELQGKKSLAMRPSLEERLKAFLRQVGDKEEGEDEEKKPVAGVDGEGLGKKREWETETSAGQMQSGGEGGLLEKTVTSDQKLQKQLDEAPSPRGMPVYDMASNEWWHDLWPHDSPPHSMAKPLGENVTNVSGAGAEFGIDGRAGPEREKGLIDNQQTTFVEGAEDERQRGRGKGGGNEEDRLQPPLLLSPSVGKRFSRHSSERQMGPVDNDSGVLERSKKQKSV